MTGELGQRRASQPSGRGGSDGIAIRPLRRDDATFLEEMLYQAIWTPSGAQRPSRDITSDPALACYVEGWGSRDGDLGFLAYDSQDFAPVGAVWLRKLSEPGGYGYWDDETPKLSMAVMPAIRGRGIGTRLLVAVTSAAATRGGAISLSVAPQNPAVHLYARFGFAVAARRGDSLTMVRQRAG